MSKAVKKIPKRGEIWLVDYNYKPKKGKEKELFKTGFTLQVNKEMTCHLFSNNHHLLFRGFTLKFPVI